MPRDLFADHGLAPAKMSGGGQDLFSEYGIEPPSRDEGRTALDESLSIPERLAIGTGRGFYDAYEGLGQIMLQVGTNIGAIPPAVLEEFNRKAQEGRDVYSAGDLGIAGGTGRVAGNIAAAVVPGGLAAKAAGITKLAAGAGRSAMLARAALNTGAGAGGGAMQFVGEGDSRTQNALAGAALGAALAPIGGAIGRRISALGRTAKRAVTRRQRVMAARLELRTVPELTAAQSQQIADDIGDGFTPEQALRKFEIEELGAVPTRGKVTGGLDDLRFEQEQRRIAGAITDADQAARAGVADKMQGRVAQFSGGRPVDRDAVGQGAADALGAGKRAAHDLTGEAYDRADEVAAQLDPSLRVRTGNTAAAVAEQADNLSLPESQALRSALGRHDLIRGDKAVVKGLTPGQAVAARKSVQRAVAPREAGMVQGKVRRALDADVEAGLGDDVYRPAREVAAKEFAAFDNREKVAVILQGKVAPERIVKLMQGASWKADDTRKMLETLDATDAAAGNMLRAGFVDDVLAAGRGATDTQGVNFMTPATLNRRLDQIGQAKLAAVIGKGAALDLMRFSRLLAKHMAPDQRIVNPGTSADWWNQAGALFGRLVDALPGGRWVLGLARMAKAGAGSRETERRVSRALNLEILKRENVLGDLLAPRSSPAAALAAGQQGGRD